MLLLAMGLSVAQRRRSQPRV